MKVDNEPLTDLIFDLDGTLIDSARDIVGALKVAYITKYPDKETDFSRVKIGPPLGETISLISPDMNETDKSELIAIFKNVYDTCSYPQTYLYLDVYEVLLKISSTKCTIYLATNKRLVPTLRILEKFGLTCFREIVCSDSHGRKFATKKSMLEFIIEKYSLNPNRSLMVGDTVSDITAASALNMKTAAVSYGCDSSSTLKSASPTYLFDRFESLLDLFKP